VTSNSDFLGGGHREVRWEGLPPEHKIKCDISN
jgi:hypothetical protein